MKYPLQTFKARDYKGDIQSREIRGEILTQIDAVTLLKTSATQYTIVYGLEVTPCVNWETAASRFGYALFHQLECNGKINRGE